MTLEQAQREAREIAEQEGVAMAVTWNPYDDEPREECRYGFVPQHALDRGLLPHESVVERIPAGG